MEFQPSALRSAREAAGLTQSSLAKLSGIGESTIYYLESDRIKGPRTTTIKRLAEVLRVDWSIFFASATQLIEQGTAVGSKQEQA